MGNDSFFYVIDNEKGGYEYTDEPMSIMWKTKVRLYAVPCAVL